MWSVAPKSMTHVEEAERKHVLVLPDSASVVMDVDVDLSIFDNEQTEIFDLYSATSYNSGVHVLDYGNNDTQLLLRVSC